MKRLFTSLLSITLLTIPISVSAQTQEELALREFHELVTRKVDPGTQAERNEMVAAWLEKVKEMDLGEYSFLKDIALYFGRDYEGAATGLSRYMKEYQGFPTSDYDTIIGRIFLNILTTAARSEEWEQFDHSLKISMNFYPDVRTIYRAAGNACRNSGTMQALTRLENLTTGLVHDERLTDEERLAALEGIYRAPRKESPFKTFNSEAMDGRPVSPADYRGKVVLIDYWATWCSPCMEEMPNVVRIYRKYHEQGLEIIGVSLDREGAEQTIREVMNEYGMTWRQVYDGKYWQAELARLNNIRSIPATFLIDRKGNIRYTNLRGAELERRIRELLAESTGI